MQRCEVCGNEYEHIFEIQMNGKIHHFDCFECAVYALAPSCAHCGVRVMGHGIEGDFSIYCSGHCARAQGHASVRDNVRHSESAVM